MILSHHAWRLRLRGDPDIIGRPVTVGGEPAEVVGVLPEGYRYPFAITCDFYEPIRFTPDQRRYRGIHSYDGIGRLKESVTFEQARAEMEVISKQLESQYPDSNTGHVVNLVRLEPNVSFTPDQKWVVFRSNMFGPTYVFAVEVAKATASGPSE